MVDSTAWTAIAGVFIGTVGATLGVFNTWRQVQRDKLKVKVVPLWAQQSAEGYIYTNTGNDALPMFGIEAINLSEFAITLSSVGFIQGQDRRAAIHAHKSLQPNGELPYRLEPRERYAVYFPIAAVQLDFSSVRAAYIATACGETISGTSKALTALSTGAHNRA